MFTVRDSFETCPTLMRDACCQTLMDMAEKNKDIVVLDSDLVNSSGLKLVMVSIMYWVLVYIQFKFFHLHSS